MASERVPPPARDGRVGLSGDGSTTGARPRRPRRPGSGGLPAPLAFCAAYGLAVAVSLALGAAGARHDTDADLLVLTLAAAVSGLFARRPAGALPIGLVYWAFFDGFLLHSDGNLGWDGSEPHRLFVLTGAAIAGALAAFAVRLIRQPRR
ncbi:hypothetical protein BIV57_05545 [Mangrovactinospora gilvigrisea]|uniref:Uncharacterized protein n=1 Tax=Mangrovactinospora gilvigrisea TaxID=1428644 RepID=A0A1J7BII1_9ACTN|nr:hypothetical protein [Mangrovactinospora gilvigrisea]OIV38467.1 hypothetical protein BIV57_05545 [Mangrovactinospora gilvigrisea]